MLSQVHQNAGTAVFIVDDAAIRAGRNHFAGAEVGFMFQREAREFFKFLGSEEFVENDTLAPARPTAARQRLRWFPKRPWCEPRSAWDLGGGCGSLRRARRTPGARAPATATAARRRLWLAQRRATRRLRRLRAGPSRPAPAPDGGCGSLCIGSVRSRATRARRVGLDGGCGLG